MEAGYRIDRPNRAKASSKSTRAMVILLLLISAALMSIVIVGGWSVLQGAQVVQIGYVIAYVGMAVLVGRWSRGALALAGALAIVLTIFAAVAAPGWLDRDKSGFAQPHMLFGGAGLDAQLLGLVTLLVIPAQVLLIAFAAQGFRQDWQVEVEVPSGHGPGGHGGLPAAA